MIQRGEESGKEAERIAREQNTQTLIAALTALDKRLDTIESKLPE